MENRTQHVFIQIIILKRKLTHNTYKLYEFKKKIGYHTNISHFTRHWQQIMFSAKHF